jgi:hypothetical protein
MKDELIDITISFRDETYAEFKRVINSGSGENFFGLTCENLEKHYYPLADISHIFTKPSQPED